MPRNKEETEGLSLLGNKKTVYKDTYAPEVLETFVNKHQGNDYMVTFDCPEFTSLCPITGQPDFAKITINYIPNVKMVESKSLKLYLFSFRNQGDFHEDCINIIICSRNILKLKVFSRRAAAYLFIRLQTTVNRVLNMKKSLKTDCLTV